MIYLKILVFILLSPKDVILFSLYYFLKIFFNEQNP